MKTRLENWTSLFEHLPKEHCQKENECGSLKIYNKFKYDLHFNFLYKNDKVVWGELREEMGKKEKPKQRTYEMTERTYEIQKKKNSHRNRKLKG